jgi:ribosomal protein S27E
MDTHPAEVACFICGQLAEINGYVSDPDTLAKLTELFELPGTLKSYYLVNCPTCGEQIQEAA